MKLFTKIALASALAMSANAMAMQAMDDSALSSATGQDGIDLTIKTSGITIDKMLIHDNDGLSSGAMFAGASLGGTDTAGAIIINDISIMGQGKLVSAGLTSDTLAKISIDTDAGQNGTEPFLNIAALIDGIDITVDSIQVGASNAAPSATGAATRGATNAVDILSGYPATDKIGISLGSSNLNIQLGNQPQGALIKINGVITGGLSVSNVAIKDSVNGGAIGIDSIRVTDSNSADLTVNTDIKATVDGLEISGTGKHDIYISAVRLGDSANFAASSATRTPSIGSVEIQGLDMGTSSLLVSGH